MNQVDFEKLKQRLEKTKEENEMGDYTRWQIYGRIGFYAEKDEITASQFLKLMDEYFFDQ